jgi:hypothetical protein
LALKRTSSPSRREQVHEPTWKRWNSWRSVPQIGIGWTIGNCATKVSGESIRVATTRSASAKRPILDGWAERDLEGERRRLGQRSLRERTNPWKVRPGDERQIAHVNRLISILIRYTCKSSDVVAASRRVYSTGTRPVGLFDAKMPR